MSLEDPYIDVRGTNHTQVDHSDTLSWTDSCIDPRTSHNSKGRSSSSFHSRTKKSPESVCGSISPPEITSQMHETFGTSRDKKWTTDWSGAANAPLVNHNDGPHASSQDFFLNAVESTEREPGDKMVSRERENPQGTQLNAVEVKEEEGRNSNSPDSAGTKSAGTRGTYKISSSRSVAPPTKPIPSSTPIGDHKLEEIPYTSSRRRGYAPKQIETSQPARTRKTSDEELRAKAQRYYAEITVNKNISTSELRASWLRGPNNRKRSHAETSYSPKERGGEGSSESIEEALATQASIDQRIDDIYGKGAHRKKRFRDRFMQSQSLASEGSQNRGKTSADEPASLASSIAQGQIASSPVRGLNMNGLDFLKTEDDSQISHSSGAFTNNLAMAQNGNGDIFSGFNTTQHRNLASTADTKSEHTQVLGDTAPLNFRSSTTQPALDEPSEAFGASAEGNTMLPEHHTFEQQSGSDRLDEQHRHDEVILNQLNDFNRNLNAVVDLRGHMTSTLQNFATKIGKLETEAVTQAQQFRALQAVSAKQAVKIRVIEEKCAAQEGKIKFLEARYSSRLGGLSNTAAPLGSPFSYHTSTPANYNSGSIGTAVSSQGFLGNLAPGGGARTSVPSYGAYMTVAAGNGSGNNGQVNGAYMTTATGNEFGNNGQANGAVTNNVTGHNSGPNVQSFGLFSDSNNGPGRNVTSTVSDLSCDTEMQTVDDSGRPYASDHNL
ncbi:hypothetical protein BDV97DRAFT_225994 [Delphinella strobiligena]|nr:hypothetical protein BDV97DRAFT_225994 [Delphinella strobiligena]